MFSWPLLCSAGSFTINQAITRNLWNPKIYYPFEKASRFSWFWSRSVQSQISQPIYLRSILILSFHLQLDLSKWSHFFRFPHQNRVCSSRLSHTSHMSHRSHSPSLHHPKRLWWKTQIMKPSLCDVLQFPVTPSI